MEALAITLAVIAAFLGPLASRYTATRQWLLRILATPQAPHLEHGLENVVVHRWLVLAAIGAPLVTLAAVVAAFIYAWWAAIIALIACIYLFALVGRTAIIPRELEWYLDRFLATAARVEQDCARGGDPIRIAIARGFREELARVCDLYRGSHVPVPSVRAAEATAHGDVRSLFPTAAGVA